VCERESSRRCQGTCAAALNTFEFAPVLNFTDSLDVRACPIFFLVDMLYTRTSACLDWYA
jgi:hypothetical protein